MLNRSEHEVVLKKILFDIYKDIDLASVLGFKGGTACYLFYGLPRFSTDLDFDLLDIEKKELVLQKIGYILEQYGVVKEKIIKRSTVFLLLSYSEKSMNVKIEINIRNDKDNKYEIKDYLGVPIKTMEKEYLSANKFAAILDRKKIANRDFYDAFFFLKNNWPIDEGVIKKRTGKNKKEYFKKIISFIEKQKNIHILHQLGEVLDEKQKAWIKGSLIKELLFLLKIYSK